MSPSNFTRYRHFIRLGLCASALAALLSACGGGGGNAGDILATTTTTAGTVNGFASVIVDGLEIEDANASTRSENFDGSYTNVALRLGQRVEIAQSVSTSGTATSIVVRAALMGSVNSVNAAAGEFKAAGQWVKVNTDATLGPVTTYGGGYTEWANLAAGDLIEVHGSTSYSTSKAAYVIQATRIDKQASISAVRISGKVAGLDSTAKRFSLNGVTVNYAGASLVPTGTTLANDQTVLVWGPSGSLTGGSAPVLAATRLRVASSAQTVATSGTGQLGGLVSAYDASAKTFEIDGVRINAATATLTPSTASLASGAYVNVTGSFGSTGVLTATSIRVRQQDTTTALASIRLLGAISSYVSPTSFVVRGLPVDASDITLSTACPGVTLADGVVVDLTATQQAGTDVLKATSLRCQSSSATQRYTMRGLQGTAGSVDANAKTFVLTQTSGTQKVQWSDQTAWGKDISASTVGTTTATLVVEGYLDSTTSPSVLVARSVRVLGTADVDRYAPGGTRPGSDDGWGNYNNRFRSGRK